MIRIVNGPQDIKGFDQTQLFRVYETQGDDGELVALATTVGEALDARSMLVELTGRTYHISPPKSQAN